MDESGQVLVSMDCRTGVEVDTSCDHLRPWPAGLGLRKPHRAGARARAAGLIKGRPQLPMYIAVPFSSIVLHKSVV